MSDQQFPGTAESAPGQGGTLSRRNLLKFGSLGAAALGAGSLLAACGGGSSGSTSSSSSSGSSGASSGGRKATVRMWTWYTQQQQEFPRLVSEFEAKNPNIKVENRIFGTPDQFLPALAAAVSAGNPPEIFAPHIRALTYGQQGVSADLRKELGDQFLSDFFKSTRDEYTLDGKQYALGWMAQTFGIFYNPAMLKAAGVSGEPETWDDLIAAAAKITSKTGKAAVALSASPATSGLDFFLPLLAQVTNDPTYYLRLDKLQGTSYTDKPVIDALTLLQKIVRANVFQKGVNGTAGNQAEQLFYTGGSAMLFNGSWTPQDLITNAPKGFAQKVKVMQTPALKPGAKHYTANQAGAGLAVSATSKNKDAALEFIKFIYSPDQYAKTMNDSNSMPSTVSAAKQVSNPVLKQMTSWLTEGLGVPHIPFGNGSSEAGGPLASIYDNSSTPQAVAQQMQQAVKNARG